MKKLFIIHASVNFRGGVGTVIKNLIGYQLDMGYKVGILYNVNSQDELFDFSELMTKIELISYKRPSVKGLNTLLGTPLRRYYIYLKNKFPDYNIIFHVHNTSAIGVLSKVRYIPLICTIHGINSSKTVGSQQSMKWILNKLINANKPIVSVSRNTAEYYFKDLMEDERISIISNGAKVEKKIIDNENEYFNIGYISYIDDLKGWRFLFDAFLMLVNDYGNKIRLTIAGDGPLDQVNELKKLINQYKLEDVVFYNGYVSNAGELIFPYLDVFVLPSKSEGMPMTILEALGNSVPVLATSVGGIPEVLIDGYNGMLVKRDAVDIYDKLRILIENDNIFDSIKKNTRPSYLEKFTVTAMGEKYDELYHKMGRIQYD